jgi:conjugative transposon TraM protein
MKNYYLTILTPKNMSTNNQTNESKSLTNEQRQTMKKYAVFALMGIIFAGCMWFIFKPSENENREGGLAGFNTDIPMPKEETIIGDKRDAYEQEQMKQRQAERMRSLDDFSSLMGESGRGKSNDLELQPDEYLDIKTSGTASSQRTSGVQNSLNAYHDINRTLGNFYEKPREDPEKERLKQELEELKSRMDETDNRKRTMDEQVELMEKSFQMAAKYSQGMTAAGAAGGTGEQVAASTKTNTSDKTPVVPVSGLVEKTVSALPQEMSGKDVMLALSQPRNMGFFTATAEGSKQRKNTISACIHADQTVMDGESVRLRLTEAMQAGKMIIHENSILSGFAKIQGERLYITIQSLEFEGTVIPVEIAIYDTDGQKGIFIPNTQEVNAVKEIAAGMTTNAGTSISLSNDAGKQFAADMGRSVVQGTAQFLSKKLREVKVKLKAGYMVLLVPNDK